MHACSPAQSADSRPRSVPSCRRTTARLTTFFCPTPPESNPPTAANAETKVLLPRPPSASSAIGMFDAIIVGARGAGSPIAMLLARRGYRVLLVDKSTFPSDTMSGHYLHPP